MARIEWALLLLEQGTYAPAVRFLEDKEISVRSRAREFENYMDRNAPDGWDVEVAEKLFLKYLESVPSDWEEFEGILEEMGSLKCCLSQNPSRELQPLKRIWRPFALRQRKKGW